MRELRPASILVVDDNEGSRYTISRMLRKANYLVWEAATGHEALERAREKPDLIILDIQLPDTDGYEVCRKLKADPATSPIPVLHLSSSFVDSEDRAAGLEGGADGYLTYPVEPRELIANVQALLRVRQAERVIREQRELLQVTLASIGDGVITTDQEGRITFMNAVAEELTGWKSAEAERRELTEVFQLLSGEADQPPGNSILSSRDGSPRFVDNTAAPIRDGHGDVVGVVLVFRDVTASRKAMEAVRSSEEKLREDARRKDEFLAMLGHELRNPLAPVRNAIQIIRLSALPNRVVEQAAEILERQVQHMTRLVDDLLDVSRVDRGKIQLRLEEVDLVSVMLRAVESVKALFDERNQKLHVRPPTQPARVLGDAARLEQVLTNLLHNAAKYTDSGGDVFLSASREGNHVAICVRDTGIGLAPDMLLNIFGMFTQVDRSLDRSQGGLGIGLTLVKNLVEMHGGEVTAASAGLGQGSEFTVRLPALTEAERPDTMPRPAPPRGGADSRTSRRVLIVDDNVDSASSLAMLLQLQRHQVEMVHDGHEALKAVSRLIPEIVLLDIGLPGMDGYQVARELRQTHGSGLVIVAMTGYGQEEDRRRSLAAGCNGHLVKPASLEALQAYLDVPTRSAPRVSPSYEPR